MSGIKKEIILRKIRDIFEIKILYPLFSTDHQHTSSSPQGLCEKQEVLHKLCIKFMVLDKVYKCGQFPCFWDKCSFPSCSPQCWFPLQMGGSCPFPQISDTMHNSSGPAFSCRRLRRNPGMRLPWQEAVRALYGLHCIMNAMLEVYFLSSFV